MALTHDPFTGRPLPLTLPKDTVPDGIGFDLDECDECGGATTDHWFDCPERPLNKARRLTALELGCDESEVF